MTNLPDLESNGGRTFGASKLGLWQHFFESDGATSEVTHGLHTRRRHTVGPPLRDSPLCDPKVRSHG